MEKDIRVLIIPDVHGRAFWKEPVKQVLEETDKRIIFLGDYLDPYKHDFEGVSDFRERAIGNFNEIIKLKKENPDRITLLIGNHDCGYMFDLDICDTRTDYANYERISEIFHKNRELFKLADEERIGDKHFIFSHAGIVKEYAEFVFGDEVNEDNVVELFNKGYEGCVGEIIRSLRIYDGFRGYGGAPSGSLVWSDARSWYKNKGYGYGYNVFGHTQLETNDGLIEDEFADLDCREAFYINELGEIKKFNEK